MHPITQALLGWSVALFASLLFIGVGRSVARLCGERDCGHALAFVAGSWVMALLLMVAAFGKPTPPTPAALVWTEVLVATLGCVPIAIYGWRGASGRGLDWRRRRLGLPLWAWAGVLACWLIPYLVQTLVPDGDWDAAMYHRPTAIRIIEQGVMHTDPYRAQINFPALIPLFYAACMACGLVSAMTPLNMVVALLLTWATYDAGRRFLGPRAGIWAAALVLTTNILWELATDQRTDGFLALYFVAALHGAFAVFRDPRRVGLLPLLGMAMGLAFGVKLTGLLAVGLFGGATVLVLLRHRPPRFGRWLAVGVLCTAVPGAFWAVRNAVELGNPVYPFPDTLLYHTTAGELREFYPDFEPLYARSEKPPAKFLANPGGQKEPGSILNLVDVFVHPQRYQNKDYHWLQPLLFLALLLPLVDRRPRYLWIWGAGALCFLALGTSAHLVRYALPAYPILALGAGALLAHPRVRRRKGLLAAAALFTAGLAVHNHTWTWIKVNGSESLRIRGVAPLDYLLQRQTPYEWKVRRGYNLDTRSSYAAHLVNELIWDGKVPKNATVLMVGESKFELLQCNSIPDVSAEAYLWLTEFLKGDGDYRRIKANLRHIGVTHILFNGGHLDWIVTRLKMNSELQNMDYLRFSAFHALRFAEENGTRLFDDNAVRFYRIDYD